MALKFFRKIDSWFFLIVMLGFICIFPGVVPAWSTDNPVPAVGKDQKLIITADRLDADTQKSYSEFSGNVKAVQGDTVIMADRIRIYFNRGADGAGQMTMGEGAVEKITAGGHVKITAGDITALTSEAVYTSATRLLVLSGPDSTVKIGQNAIAGARITLDRGSGRITVENSGENQVRALFFTNGKGLN